MRVVVREREQQEVEEIVLDQVLAHAARVLVADPGKPELRAAPCPARREQIRVEELAGPHHRLLEDDRGDARQRGLVRHFVPVATAIHQVGRAGGPHPGVVERLEHRRRLARQVLRVHVVDRVGERALEAEGLARPEARAVLDIALLLPVVPVHRRDLVTVRSRAGRDRRRADRRHRGEGRHQLTGVLTVLEQPRQGRRAPRGHGLFEHRGLHRVDDREHQLLVRGHDAS